MSETISDPSSVFSGADILSRAAGLLGGMVLDIRLEADTMVIEVNPSDIYRAAKILKDDRELSFKYLSFVAGVDNVNSLEAVYLLRSLKHPVRAELKAKITDRKYPSVPTVTGLWSGANFHERETYDLFGIVFEGHTDLRRILNREDLDVFPSRKDARPHRKTRVEWQWPGLTPNKRLPEEADRRERS